MRVLERKFLEIISSYDSFLFPHQKTFIYPDSIFIRSVHFSILYSSFHVSLFLLYPPTSYQSFNVERGRKRTLYQNTNSNRFFSLPKRIYMPTFYAYIIATIFENSSIYKLIKTIFRLSGDFRIFFIDIL